jgi:hypothetical protein
MAQDTANRTELPRDQWPDFFNDLSRDFAGWDVTLEVLGQDGSEDLHAVEAERLPLAYMEYDHKDDVVIIAVGGQDARFPVLRHLIDKPQQVYADVLSPAMPWAVLVVAQDGGRTLATVHERTALPRPSD